MDATLTQIVPRLPPLVDGLGDYATVLAAAAEVQTGIRSRFLVSDPAWITAGGPQHAAHATAAPTDALGFAELLATAADHGVVLLHYVGYAYDQRQGRPGWLLDALTRWRQGKPGRHLVILFHELYASSAPWRKAFWLSGSQQRLAVALARLSDACFTSNSHSAAWLVRHLPAGRSCPVWPVLSNVGEPVDLPAYGQRAPALAVFGRAANRARAYHQRRKELIALCRRLDIQEVHDLGAPLSDRQQPDLPGLTIHQHGILPPAEISRILARCRVGYLDNATGRLGKSSVFAAYASHGLAPVVECPYPDEDGLKLNHHQAAITDLPAADSFPSIASAAHSWYHQHSAPVLARFLSDTIAQLTVPSTPPADQR